jgi:hypothetical protein
MKLARTRPVIYSEVQAINSDLSETRCMHFNLPMSEMKTLALCDYSVKLHETNCWKLLSSVCMFMAL